MFDPLINTIIGIFLVLGIVAAALVVSIVLLLVGGGIAWGFLKLGNFLSRKYKEFRKT